MDNVNHPAHYETGQFECIDVMIETQGIEAAQAFCVCNAFKYIYRHNNKNGVEDIKKAQWYLNKYIELEDKKMRRLKRSVARANMKRAGFTGVNRKKLEGRSFFALNWRSFI